MISEHKTSRPLAWVGLGSCLVQALTRLAKQAAIWSRRTRTRNALYKLSARELNDIGLTKEAALQEAAKPFWRG